MSCYKKVCTAKIFCKFQKQFIECQRMVVLSHQKVAKLLHLVKNYKASVETNLEHEE